MRLRIAFVNYNEDGTMDMMPSAVALSDENTEYELGRVDKSYYEDIDQATASNSHPWREMFVMVPDAEVEKLFTSPGVNAQVSASSDDGVIRRAIWNGENVEEIAELSGCSQNDIKRCIPTGSVVELYADGGWNFLSPSESERSDKS